MDDGDKTRRILLRHKTIAVVGLSAQWHRPSYFAAKYMQEHGYRVIPVNPMYEEILGEKSYKSVRDIPEKVDIVDCFLLFTAHHEELDRNSWYRHGRRRRQHDRWRRGSFRYGRRSADNRRAGVLLGEERSSGGDECRGREDRRESESMSHIFKRQRSKIIVGESFCPCIPPL
jgi:hypothetical protein